MELADEPVKPSSAATATGSRPSVWPARAPEPYGESRRHPRVPVAQPLDVAQQRPRVGQQVVRQEHGLRVLEVRAPGHDRRRGAPPACPASTSTRSSTRPAIVPGVVAQVGPEERGDLVVARAPGPEPTADLGTDLVEQQPLEGAVDVLVGGRGHQLAGVVPLPQHRQPAQQLGVVGLGEQSGAVQGVGVRPRAGEVVGRQLPVEVRRARQRLELRATVRWRSGHPTASPRWSCRRLCSASVGPDVHRGVVERLVVEPGRPPLRRAIRSAPPGSISPKRLPFSTSTWPWSCGWLA